MNRLRTAPVAWISSLILFTTLLAGQLYLLYWPVRALTPPGHIAHEGLPGTPTGAFLALLWGLSTWAGLRASKALHRKILGTPAPLRGRFAVVWSALFVFAASTFWIQTMDDYAHFGELMRLSSEGASKGNLAEVRAALAAYAKDHEGAHPPDLTALTAGAKYLPLLRRAKAPSHHPDSDAVVLGAKPDDAGGWLYDPTRGAVLVNCTHTDTKRASWTTY